jgi:site-specific DNA-methyltransferase (adenine-specific)
VNTVYLIDCMAFMKDIPDKYYELAIVDPEYRNITENQPTKDMRNNGGMDRFSGKPDEKYFIELYRISKNQIIFGANNFQLPPFKGFIVWKKKTISEDFTMSMCEIASLSEQLGTTSKLIEIAPQDKNRIHCNQKPVDLYKWILHKYAKPHDKIFDSHVGSGSSRIACYDLGFDFEGCELAADYWTAQENRYKSHISQGNLFDTAEIQTLVYKELI